MPSLPNEEPSVQFILLHKVYFTFEKNTPRGESQQGLRFA